MANQCHIRMFFICVEVKTLFYCVGPNITIVAHMIRHLVCRLNRFNLIGCTACSGF